MDRLTPLFGVVFMTVARSLDCDSIIVPNISLADSIVDGICKEQKKGK